MTSTEATQRGRSERKRGRMSGAALREVQSVYKLDEILPHMLSSEKRGSSADSSDVDPLEFSSVV